MRRIIVIAILAIAITGVYFFTNRPQKARIPESNIVAEKITLKTSDNTDIAADYYASSEDSAKGALLVHMMPATRDSWRGFAPKLQERGYHVLAIDLRGHGDSTGGPNGYRSFADKDHQKSIVDVAAGVQFLKQKGVQESQLVLIGASIGANLSLWYAGDHPDIKQIVLLSPGLNYRGIFTEPFVKKLQNDQRTFFISSRDDGDNVQMNEILYGLIPARADKKLLVYQKAGHGTDMFGKEQPDLETEILSWLK